MDKHGLMADGVKCVVKTAQYRGRVRNCLEAHHLLRVGVSPSCFSLVHGAVWVPPQASFWAVRKRS